MSDYHVRIDFPPFCHDDQRAYTEESAKFTATKLLAEKLLPNRWFTVRLRQSWNFDAERELPGMSPWLTCWVQYDIDISALEERTILTGLPDGVLRDFANREYSLRQRIIFAWRVLRGLRPPYAT